MSPAAFITLSALLYLIDCRHVCPQRQSSPAWMFVRPSLGKVKMYYSERAPPCFSLHAQRFTRSPRHAAN